MRIGEDSSKTTLDDNAFLYTKREEKTDKEKFNELKGAEKWHFFKTYMLPRILAVVGVAAFLIVLLVSLFKTKPKSVFYLGIIDNPIPEEVIPVINEDLTEMFVTDPETEQVMVSTDYYFSSSLTDPRSSFVAHISTAEIDFVIIPYAELNTYLNSETFLDLRTIVSAEVLEAYKSRQTILTPQIEDMEGNTVPGAEGVYALDITEEIEKMIGFRPPQKYYLACIANSTHTDKADEFITYFYGLVPKLLEQ